MQKVNLLGYTRPQLEELMLSMGQKKYKGGQIFNWLYGVRQYDFQLIVAESDVKSSATTYYFYTEISAS